MTMTGSRFPQFQQRCSPAQQDWKFTAWFAVQATRQKMTGGRCFYDKRVGTDPRSEHFVYVFYLSFSLFFSYLCARTHTQTHTQKHSQRAAAVGVLISINSWTGFYGEVRSLHYPRKTVVTKKGRFSHHHKQQHLSAVMYYILRTQTNLIWAM